MNPPSLTERIRRTLRSVDWLYRAARYLRALPYNLTLGLARTLLPRRWPGWGPPKALYWEYDLVRRGTIPGRVILDEQKSPALPADSLRQLCGLRQNECQPWPFFWSHRREARLVGSTLALMDDQKRLSSEAVFREHCLPGEPAYRYLRLPPAHRLAGPWTSVVSRWGYGYFHWWLDVLPRLAVLNEFPTDTGILVFPRLEAYQSESLRMLGVGERVRLTPERHVIVEDYYFASPTAMTGCWNPFAIDWLRERFLPWAGTPAERPRRFYLRRLGQSRGIRNEAEVIDYFRDQGWAIVDLEKMTVRDQIQLFSGAEFVCGLHGAAFTNLLWAPPGCRVLELCAATFLNGVYEGMAEYLRLEYRYLVCEADQAFVARVNLGELRKMLDALEREPGPGRA